MIFNKRHDNLSLFEDAQTYLSRNWSIIPVWGASQPAYFKVAAIRWSPYQNRLPRQDEIHQWFNFAQHQGIGIVTGNLSGLAVLDFDSIEKFKQFSDLFPHLTNTYIVKTPRGWHLYFCIPPSCKTDSRQTKGIDWQWEGRYVVAPPTHGYSVQNERNPRVLTQTDVTDIESFINAQTPVFTRYEPVSSHHAITDKELIAHYTQSAHQGNRNNALFNTSLLARDHGWTLHETIKVLKTLHINNRHPHESPTIRERETLATLRSAYSRLARRTTTIRQLPNTVREQLLALKQTHTIRVIEALRLKGYDAGQYISWQATWELLAGIVGRDSIIHAFQATNQHGKPLFQKVSDYRCPSPAEQSSNTDPKCFMVTTSKSGKTQTTGRPTDYFRLPSNVELARLLGVCLSHITDILTLDDLKSAKSTRMALHFRFIQRRPGKYSSQWLAQRLGISKITKNRYDRQLPDLIKCATYTIKSIFWWTLDQLCTRYDIPGQFLEDENGKRYPAKRVIAIQLLKQNISVRLMTRGFNYYCVID